MRTLSLSFLLVPAVALMASGDGDRIKSSTGAFLEFHRTAGDLPDREKIERFRETVSVVAPSIYEHRFEEWKSFGRDPDEGLLKQIEGFEEYEHRYVALNGIIHGQLQSSVRAFLQRFPDFELDFEIHLLHSLGLADGTRRTIDGEETFIIGLDMIARYHDWEDNTAFFHHELTHFYMSQHYTASEEGDYGPDALYNQLWGEGMATYVSHALNLEATNKELLLEIPYDVPARTDEVLGQVAESLLKDLFSTDWDVRMKYFAGRSEDPVIPARAGYYLGYLLVKGLAEDYELDDLIRLKDTDFVPKLRQQLEKMRDD